MLPTTTKVPQVAKKLIGLLHDATGVQVTDGPYLGELADEAMCVGLTEGPERPGYTTTINRQPGMGRPRLREDFTIRCFLSLVTGETDMAALRARAGTILGQAAETLADNHAVTDLWDRVVLGDRTEWIPVQTESGAVLSVFFTVDGSCLL
jgi:hypothetical protein